MYFVTIMHHFSKQNKNDWETDNSFSRNIIGVFVNFLNRKQLLHHYDEQNKAKNILL